MKSRTLMSFSVFGVQGVVFSRRRPRGRFNTEVNRGEKYALLTDTFVSQHHEGLVFLSFTNQTEQPRVPDSNVLF